MAELTMQTLSSAQKLVGYMLEKLTSTSDKDRSFVPFKHDGSDRAILLVNNLGGLNALELGIVMKEVRERRCERD